MTPTDGSIRRRSIWDGQQFAVALLPMWMLAPAAATIIALGVLVAGLRTVAQAAAELTGTLRRSSVTAVAGDELSRLAARLGDHAEATRAAADEVRPRGRNGSRRRPRS